MFLRFIHLKISFSRFRYQIAVKKNNFNNSYSPKNSIKVEHYSHTRSRIDGSLADNVDEQPFLDYDSDIFEDT